MPRESRAPTERDLQEVSHWIGGGPLREPSGCPGAIIFNPATGNMIRKVSYGGEHTVQSALKTASRAFQRWRTTPVGKRAAILFEYRELLISHREQLASFITEENGKTISESLAEIDRGIQVVEFACGMPHLQKGEMLPDVGSGLSSCSLRHPLGVCVGITPFNFPAMVPMWMFPVAIAAGNSFVLKPSEKDPSCSIRLAELFEKAGLPPGVLNVVHGGANTAHLLATSATTAAVSFVGSTKVAKEIYQTATAAGKRVQCLGGAKNHLVVMPDANIDTAADALVGAAYGCAGERCMAVSAAVTVGKVGNSFVEALKDRIENLRIGPGSDPETDMGPLISAQHVDRVRQYIQLGKEEGAHLVIGGDKNSGTSRAKGFYLGPALFDQVTSSMKIYQEEIFGPVLSVLHADSLEEAISLMNRHTYANGAAIFTRSGAAARRFVQVAEAGMVGINVPIPAPLGFFTFGGHKNSLFGTLHVHGTDGVRFYTRTKTITSRWPEEADTSVLSGF